MRSPNGDESSRDTSSSPQGNTVTEQESPHAIAPKTPPHHASKSHLKFSSLNSTSSNFRAKQQGKIGSLSESLTQEQNALREIAPNTPPRACQQLQTSLPSPPAITNSARKSSLSNRRQFAKRVPASFRYLLPVSDASLNAPSSPTSPPLSIKSARKCDDEQSTVVGSSVSENESYAEKHQMQFMQRLLRHAEELEQINQCDELHPSERHHHLAQVSSSQSSTPQSTVTASTLSDAMTPSIFDFAPDTPPLHDTAKVTSRSTRSSRPWNDFEPTEHDEEVILDHEKCSSDMLPSSVGSGSVRRRLIPPQHISISSATPPVIAKSGSSCVSPVSAKLRTPTSPHFASSSFIPVNTPNYISLHKMEQLLDEFDDSQPPACIILQPSTTADFSSSSCAPAPHCKKLGSTPSSVDILTYSILVEQNYAYPASGSTTPTSPKFQATIDSITKLNSHIPFYYHQILFQLRKYVPVIVCHNSSTDFLFSVQLYNLLLNEQQCHELYILDCPLQELHKKRADLFISRVEHEHRLTDTHWIQNNVKTVHDLLFRNLGTHSNEWISTSPSTRILRHLYVGCARNSFEKKQLLDLNVSGIVNAAAECESHFPETFEYLKCDLDDHPQEDIAQYFEMTFQFIERLRRQKKACFVHCFVGASRSVTIVIAYIMRKKNWSFKRAYRYVSKRRTETDVNYGFCHQLMEYETVLSRQCNVIEYGSPTTQVFIGGASLL